MYILRLKVDKVITGRAQAISYFHYTQVTSIILSRFLSKILVLIYYLCRYNKQLLTSGDSEFGKGEGPSIESGKAGDIRDRRIDTMGKDSIWRPLFCFSGRQNGSIGQCQLQRR